MFHSNKIRIEMADVKWLRYVPKPLIKGINLECVALLIQAEKLEYGISHPSKNQNLVHPSSKKGNSTTPNSLSWHC